MSNITDRAVERNRRAWDAFRQQQDEGLVNIRPRIDPATAAKILETDISKMGVGYLSPSQVSELVGDVSGKRLLDMGCGDGDEMFQWALLGADVVGVDNSPKQLEAARDNANALGISCRFVLADLLHLPDSLLKGEFDIVFSSAVICWIGDLVRWVRNVFLALKPGGIFLLNAAHPLTAFARDIIEGESNRESYFSEGPFSKQIDGAHDWNPADDEITTVEWYYTLGSLVTAVGQSCLRIADLIEHPGCGNYENWPGGFTLRAVKE